jgi:hypothetical protein
VPTFCYGRSWFETPKASRHHERRFAPFERLRSLSARGPLARSHGMRDASRPSLLAKSGPKASSFPPEELRSSVLSFAALTRTMVTPRPARGVTAGTTAPQPRSLLDRTQSPTASSTISISSSSPTFFRLGCAQSIRMDGEFVSIRVRTRMSVCAGGCERTHPQEHSRDGDRRVSERLVIVSLRATSLRAPVTLRRTTGGSHRRRRRQRESAHPSDRDTFHAGVDSRQRYPMRRET